MSTAVHSARARRWARWFASALLWVVVISTASNSAGSDEPAVVLPNATQMTALPFVALPRFFDTRANSGVAIHQIDDPALLDAVRDAGFSFVRTDLFWDSVETPRGWDFSRYDALVANLRARRLGALFILGYGHPRYAPKQPPTSSAQIDAFAEYATQAARHYRDQPVRFEVWNEQDHKDYWLAPPSPAAYRNLLEATVRAVKASNPDAVVATGGVQQVDVTFIRAVGDIGSASQPAPDAVSVHPYRQNAPETALGDYAALARDLATYRTVPAIWATEWSYPTYAYKYVSHTRDGHDPVARERQARYAVRRLLVDWIAQIGLTAYYDMRNDGRDPKNMEHNFGLLDADNTPLPAYVAVRHLFSFTANARAARLFLDPVRRFAVLQLRAEGVVKYVVWCYGNDKAVDVDLSQLPVAGTFASDLYGASLDITGRRLTLREEQGPVFIVSATGR
ncbi:MULTISPECIES: cellulase family glycosylhydrolase [Burkholderia]|uniref:Glycosyl hydrolase family 5 n=1 Tax=Burkholderia cepacia TaxID=292 RepID=A0ABM6P3L6_BURCE|nr:cellulase family glycosylhydrolase [Burkholderia cepacia]AIO28863.1 glycosyl hydrolases 39 family protein [Burkholderia cepacia ATCC 25416]ALK19782.1 glycosyl hydrolase family 5 [Burkholderia cepacia ATCC 25416]ASE97475.1 glycosyl hydrolase family 5 [Burkholderia cepacia]ATF81572.1 glycosyl hydrolase family 5 [Burkholderia cepacia]MCA7890621.1 glycoside hydrolase family 5 protein [Burkholderia cepacia]